MGWNRRAQDGIARDKMRYAEISRDPQIRSSLSRHSDPTPRFVTHVHIAVTPKFDKLLCRCLHCHEVEVRRRGLVRTHFHHSARVYAQIMQRTKSEKKREQDN